MESKVIMLDASGAEIGETYTRRARQLVKQQRAMWADDAHTSIRFMPDKTEDWELEMAYTPSPASAPAPPPETERTSTLYAIAAKRMRDRRRIIWHSLALIPVFIIIAWWGVASYHMSRHGAGHGYLILMGFCWGVWATAYVNHLRSYLRSLDHLPRSTRKRLMLDAEVDRLRRMGYTE